MELTKEDIAQDNYPDDEPPAPIDSEESKRRIAQINRESRSKEEKKAIKTLEDKYLPKLQEYEKYLETLWKRSSYQKAWELLYSQVGLLHRSRRPTEHEAVFEQTKANKRYNRFRHSDKGKVMMGFAIHALAFNRGKVYRETIIDNKLSTKSLKQDVFLVV